jgi:hypothetical protein
MAAFPDAVAGKEPHRGQQNEDLQANAFHQASHGVACTPLINSQILGFNWFLNPERKIFLVIYSMYTLQRKEVRTYTTFTG